MRPILAHAGRHLRSAGFVLLLAALTALAGGCVREYDEYTIVLTPRGDSLERNIRIQRPQGREDSLRGVLQPHLEPGVRERLYRVYHVATDTAMTAPYVARGRFADVPDDIGTQGHYRHWSTPLGESYFYAERIRGMADPAGWIARRFASADTLASGVADWLRFELVTQPEWPRVSGTLEPELNSIARTFAAVTLTTSADASLQPSRLLTVAEDSLQLGWLLTFAPEHPLFALLGVPLLENSDDAASLAPFLGRARADLARRLGLRSVADEARVLGFLADGPTLLASYQRWAARAPEARALDRDAAQRLFATMTEDPRVRGGAADVVVELRAPRPPFITNGRWSDSLRCVRWSASCAKLSERDASLPLACAAVWSVPDSITQCRLFGEVVLDDAELFDYADQFAALAPARQAEWNRMLLGLRPSRLEPLDRFRFAGERGGTDASSSIRAIIQAALSAKAGRRAATAGKAAPPRSR